MHCNHYKFFSKGFTLLETLVALAILAIALAAAIRAGFSSADQAHQIKIRTQAAWVAENVLNELLATHTFPQSGSQLGKAIQGETEFVWKLEASNMPDNRFRRVEVRVFLSEDEHHALARQVTHIPHQD